MKRVIKIGGRAQKASMLPLLLTKAWAADPGSMCIVHGGGDEVSALQRQLGVEPQFIGGRRATREDDIRLLRMVLSGVANKRLVSSLISAGAPAVGVSGEDGGLIMAEPFDIGSLGFAGRPVSVDTTLIELLLGGGFLPAISPLARSAAAGSGGTLNINGDDAAAAIAVALSADELLFLADVEGVLGAGGELLAALDQAAADDLVAAGTVNGGMQAKLQAGYSALAGGIPKVRVSGLNGILDPEQGTVLSCTPSAVA